MNISRIVMRTVVGIFAFAFIIVPFRSAQASNAAYDQCVATAIAELQACTSAVDQQYTLEYQWYLRSRTCWAKYGAVCGISPKPVQATFDQMKAVCQATHTEAYTTCQNLLDPVMSCDFPVQGEVSIHYVNSPFYTANSYTEPLDVNDFGVVVGKQYISNTVYHSFHWSKQPGADQGETKYQWTLLAGHPGADYAYSITHAINNTGTSVGQSGINSSLTEYYAYFMQLGNAMIKLPLFSGPQSTKNIAYDVNDSNTIVGYSLVPGTTGVPVVWQPSTSSAGGWLKYNPVTALPALNASAPKGVAYALNNSNTIVGRVGNTVGQLTPVMWKMVNNVWNLQVIGNVGGQHGEALGVNSSDVAVGWSNKTGSTDVFAFAWSGSKGHTVLNPLTGHVGSYANDISDTGIVVGQSMTTSSVDIATLWPAVGCDPINVNTLVPATSTPWVLDKVTAISSNGRYITGTGHVKAALGKKHGWMIDLGVQ